MSRNFELMRKVKVGRDLVEPLPLDAYEENRREGLRLVREFPVLAESVETRDFDLAGLLSRLRHHWRLPALFAGTVMLTAIIVTALMKPIYIPTARLEIDPPSAALIDPQNPASDTGSDEYLDTQVKNLKSDELAVAVIRELHLDRNPELVPPASNCRIPRRPPVRLSQALRQPRTRRCACFAKMSASNGTRPAALSASASKAMIRCWQPTLPTPCCADLPP